jgi:Sec-independent protein translocase protein TatA
MARILWLLAVLVVILVLVGKSNTQQLATSVVDLVQAVTAQIQSSLK